LETNRHSLVARLRDGDHAAANELVHRYYEQIYLYFRRLGHGRHTSEDLTQECFLQTWQHVGQLRDDRSLNGWLYHIANNTSRLCRRRNRGKKTATLEDFNVPAGKVGVEDFEQLESLKQAVHKLSRKSKEAVVLHYMHHLTIAEAAEAAGVAQGTFKSRLARALRTLRRELT
jgi:RNA polymerase sigma-70 factor (ECF subfamily)